MEDFGVKDILALDFVTLPPVRGPNNRHGMDGTPTYQAWNGMKNRCSNPKRRSYPRYGGRGVGYDPEWESFDNFYRDMGEKPEGLTLERKDNDKGYNKDNCCWASVAEQNKNRSNSIWIGDKTLSQVCKEKGISYNNGWQKYRKGTL